MNSSTSCAPIITAAGKAADHRGLNTGEVRRRAAMHGHGRGFVAAAGLAMLLAAAQVGAQPVQRTLEGVWQVMRQGVNCQTGQVLRQFPAIMTFNKDGTVTGYAIPPGSSPALVSPESGLWKREAGWQSYSFRLVSYNYDEDGAFDGSTQISAQVELAPSGIALSYEAAIQFFDAGGNLLFSPCGKAEGSRFE